MKFEERIEAGTTGVTVEGVLKNVPSTYEGLIVLLLYDIRELLKTRNLILMDIRDKNID